MESKKWPLAIVSRIEETIPTPLEWEDVAHLYLKANIEFTCGASIVEFRPDCGFLLACDGQWEPDIVENGAWESFGIYKDDVFVRSYPILRHIGDMTQADADSLARAIGLTGDWFTASSLGAIMRGNTTERERLFGDPRAWVWALNEGFDMFRLIERELAIRKEVQNG